MFLTNEELNNINGGFVNVLLSIGRNLYNWGKSLGSSLRRIITKTICPI